MVPFMGAGIAISVDLKCEPNALSQNKWLIGAWHARRPVGADKRRLAYRGASGTYTLFCPGGISRQAGLAQLDSGTPKDGLISGPDRRIRGIPCPAGRVAWDRTVDTIRLDPYEAAGLQAHPEGKSNHA
jgi:hypothetical protein